MRIISTCAKKTGTITILKIVNQYVTNALYGALYNWYAVNDSRLIAPAGWHVPTKTEWTTLLNSIDSYDSGNSRYPLAGGYLKEAGLVHWDTPNEGADNSTGFGMRGAGARDMDGVFWGFKQYAQIWLPDIEPSVPGNALQVSFSTDESSVYFGDTVGTTMVDGQCIRLLKDDSTDPGTMTDNDGNVYPTVKIGDQVWMAENLYCTHFRNAIEGSVAQGYLYNYYALSGLAGSGWRVPSWDDYLTLASTLGGYSVAGGKMKETGTTYWDSPNTGADNSSGFNGRGSGTRATDGAFTSIRATLSLATTYYSGGTWVIPQLSSFNDDLAWASTNHPYFGVSVRLIKENSTLSSYTGNDGKTYASVKIGDQVWLSENLMETKYSDGSTISVVTDNSTWAGLSTGARCAYSNDGSIAGVEPQSDEIPLITDNSAWAALSTAGMCYYDNDSSNSSESGYEQIADDTEFEVTITGQGADPDVVTDVVTQSTPLVVRRLKFDDYVITETPPTGYTLDTIVESEVTLTSTHRSETVTVTNIID
jgi:uncharacterized protein (TIGR02145 family)